MNYLKGNQEGLQHVEERTVKVSNDILLDSVQGVTEKKKLTYVCFPKKDEFLKMSN